MEGRLVAPVLGSRFYFFLPSSYLYRRPGPSLKSRPLPLALRRLLSSRCTMPQLRLQILVRPWPTRASFQRTFHRTFHRTFQILVRPRATSGSSTATRPAESSTTTAGRMNRAGLDRTLAPLLPRRHLRRHLRRHPRWGLPSRPSWCWHAASVAHSGRRPRCSRWAAPRAITL